jgi:ABC-type multidrug transport system fused ATPase/permease subunit
MEAKRPNIFLFLLRHAWRYTQGRHGWFIVFYMLSLAGNIIEKTQPYIFSQIINTAQLSGGRDVGALVYWCLLFAGASLGFWLLHGPSRIIERRLAYYAYRQFTTDLYNRVTRLPLAWHQDNHTGMTINRVTKASRALLSFTQDQFGTISMFIGIIVPTLTLALFSVWVAVATVIACSLILLVVVKFDKSLITLYDAVNEREHKISSALYDYIGNIVSVLTLRLQPQTQTELDSRLGQMKPFFWREITLSEFKWFTRSILLVVIQIGIPAVYLIHHALSGKQIMIGDFVAIFQYLGQVNGAFMAASGIYGTLGRQYADINAVRDLMNETSPQRLKPMPVNPDWRSARLQGLAFTHRKGDVNRMQTLRDVDMTLMRGQKIALVGSSGAGKTTMLTLLRGLYEADKVKVTIDGQDYDSLSVLADFTTLIPQDTEIFENTIRYNLTMGIDLPDTMIQQAMEITALDKVIANLPLGLETDIRERGVNLSGGQKQRLALTRGLLAARDSSLILLDEPTSSVDVMTEATIFTRLFERMKDRTIVATIHRLHLLPRFDQVCFMQNGTVVQQGSFSDLVREDGPFFDLWRNHLTRMEEGYERAPDPTPIPA